MVRERKGLSALVIDDEESIREGCRQALEAGGYLTWIAPDGVQGLRLIEDLRPKIVLVDLKMPGVDGLEILQQIRRIDPGIVSIVITGYGTVDSAVEAMRRGAADYLRKPFDDKVLLETVRRGVNENRMDVGLSPAQGLRPVPDDLATAPTRGVSAAAGGTVALSGAARPAVVSVEPRGFHPPAEVAAKVAGIAGAKCRLQLLPMAMLGILAGGYIGFGAELSTMVSHDLTKHVGVGFAKFVAGSVFSVGLMLVILAGAELFTGNSLILAGVLHGGCSTKEMFRNWSVVYLTNFAGSVLLAALMYGSGLWRTGQLGVGASALRIAAEKVGLSFGEAFLRGVGCNWLVCLAVWLAIAGKDAVSKIFGIYFPIMAFVASGFEHSIANMYFVPMGLFLKTNAAVVKAAGLTGAVQDLTWTRFLTANLFPVTLGNVVGGGLFVAGIYYLIYLRDRARA